MQHEQHWMHLYQLARQGVSLHPNLINSAQAARGPLGQTFLHWLVLEAEADAIVEVLAAGADPNQQNDLGNTPLMEAAAAGRWDVVTALLDRGADVNICNYDDENLQDYLALFDIKMPPELMPDA